jgi:pimeloyl-ACP methyl ester carboxylesterase
MATTILVHGVWMNGMEMSLLRRRLRKRGYHTVRFRYASLFSELKSGAAKLQQLVSGIDDETVHFVAHSLGGLLVRHFFHDYPEQKPGRVITLGTPHRGSLVAERFNHHFAGKLLLGKSLHRGLLGDVPPWSNDHEIGVIAGNRSLGVGKLFVKLPKPNDGTVAVAETPLPGMKAYKVMRETHISLLFSETVVKEVAHFLETGQFTSE